MDVKAMYAVGMSFPSIFAMDGAICVGEFTRLSPTCEMVSM
jgi:hypothetical protein